MKDQFDKLIYQMVEAGVFFQDAVTELEKRYIRRVLESNGWNQLQASKTLGIHRNTLGRKIDEYKIANGNGFSHAVPGKRKKSKKK